MLPKWEILKIVIRNPTKDCIVFHFPIKHSFLYEMRNPVIPLIPDRQQASYLSQCRIKLLGFDLSADGQAFSF